jgi:hypothetical protein
MINPSMSMNRNVAMLKKNSQPAIRFNDFGSSFTVLFHQFHKIMQQLQADFPARFTQTSHGFWRGLRPVWNHSPCPLHKGLRIIRR